MYRLLFMQQSNKKYKNNKFFDLQSIIAIQGGSIMINKDNKVFIPDAEYGLSRINISNVLFSFIDGIITLQLVVFGIASFSDWHTYLNVGLQVSIVLMFLAVLIIAYFFVIVKFDGLLGKAGGTKLAIIDNNVYEFNIERVTGDKRESLDVGKIKEIIDKAGNKQTAKDWIIENILRAIGREKSINLADISIPLPGETTVDTDENSEHLELAINKCEILNIKKSNHEDSIEVAYRYDFGDDEDDEDDDNNKPDGIIKYKPKNFIRFADGSLSGYKELVDSLESIQKQKEQG